MNILEQILIKIFCLHKWERFHDQRVKTDLGDTFTVMHFCCKTCGKFKKRKSY